MSVSQTINDQPQDASPRDLATRLLRGPLTLILALLCLVQLLTWLPHYVTWPFWADHDSYATLAKGWTVGVLPYRDLRCNQFPGVIYLFWVLGQIGGWGNTVTLYAFDGGTVLLFAGAMLVWSKRLFGAVLPGLVGTLSFLSFYLGLDYAFAAQREWHVAFLCVLAIFVLQIWPSRNGATIVAGLLMAMAVSIRPHAVLFLPAIALQIHGEGRGSAPYRRAILGISVFGAALGLLFGPLFISGIFRDFLGGLGNSLQDKYTPRAHATGFISGLLRQFETFKMVAVPVCLMLIPKAGDSDRKLVRVWLAVFALCALYRPVHPRYHFYLTIPLEVVYAVNLAVLAQLILASTTVVPLGKLVGILLVLGLTAKVKPEFCGGTSTLEAIARPRGTERDTKPPGYRRSALAATAYYEWDDYHGTIEYLRTHVSEHTRIANALKGDPAIVGPLGRLPAFPSEGISWLRMVNPADEPNFARALEATPDSVVVWSPGEPGVDPLFKIDLIEAVIRRLYEPEARFGAIEVWRRKS